MVTVFRAVGGTGDSLDLEYRLIRHVHVALPPKGDTPLTCGRSCGVSERSLRSNLERPPSNSMGMRDDELVTAALAGDPAAFAALVEGNRARVETVVERMVGEEAEDLVQEALLRAYLGLSQLRDPARFGAWLCGIAVNLAKMRLRRRALEVRLSLEPTSDGGFEERELLQLVRNAVDVLPPGQRDAVLMHYIDGLSCEEVALLLGSSPGAIRVRLHRARQRLREQLATLAPAPTPKEEIRMIEMRLEDVIVRVAEDDPMKVVADRRIVLLKEAASLREKTFYAVIAIAANGRIDELDARPSDALNLAARVGAPIFVDDDVLEQGATPAGDLHARLDAEADEADHELPPGEWRSLSAELLQSLYQWR